MKEQIKKDIKTCFNDVYALSEKIDNIHERVLTENSKDDMDIFICIMNLQKMLKQCKSEAQRIEWYL